MSKLRKNFIAKFGATPEEFFESEDPINNEELVNLWSQEVYEKDPQDFIQEDYFERNEGSLEDSEIGDYFEDSRNVFDGVSVDLYEVKFIDYYHGVMDQLKELKSFRIEEIEGWMPFDVNTEVPIYAVVGIATVGLKDKFFKKIVKFMKKKLKAGYLYEALQNKNINLDVLTDNDYDYYNSFQKDYCSDFNKCLELYFFVRNFTWFINLIALGEVGIDSSEIALYDDKEFNETLEDLFNVALDEYSDILFTELEFLRLREKMV